MSHPAADQTTPPAPSTPTPEQLAELTTALADLLGLDPATADLPAAILDAVTALVDAEAANAGNSDAVAATARRIGMETIDKGVLATLRADAADAEKLRNAAAEKELDDLIASAVTRGKIASSRREHWRTMLRRDPAARADLASIADNTIPMAARGYDTPTDPGDQPQWFR